MTVTSMTVRKKVLAAFAALACTAEQLAVDASGSAMAVWLSGSTTAHVVNGSLFE
jgi:hypothetical protein